MSPLKLTNHLRGDEIMIVDLDHTHKGMYWEKTNSLVTPKTFTPYRIFGITHRQREIKGLTQIPEFIN